MKSNDKSLGSPAGSERGADLGAAAVRRPAAAEPDYRIVNPKTFAREMILAAERDPGCEVKVMLFQMDDGRELHFSHFESGERILSLILTAHPTAATAPPSVPDPLGPTRPKTNNETGDL